MQDLQKLLGHYSVAVTEKYAHLTPDFFSRGVHQRFAVDLTPDGAVVDLGERRGLGAGAAR